MTDISECMRDGYSTAGSAGGGLGAISRLSDRFDIASWPGKGTAVSARFFHGGAPKLPHPALWGGLCLPMRGESVSGDGWAAVPHEGNLTILLADGLGHGPSAAEAARAATGLFSRRYALPLEELAGRLHDALRPTRGAAIAVSRLIPAMRRVEFIGIGNVAGTLIAGGQARKMLSHNGTAGHNAPKIQSFRYDYTGVALVLLHSDGLATSWSLERYPGLAVHDPALIAGILYRDYCRGRDDVMVVAMGAARELGHTRPAHRAGDGYCHRAPARQTYRRAAWFRRPGPDPHRHRRLGNRPQCTRPRRRRTN